MLFIQNFRGNVVQGSEIISVFRVPLFFLNGETQVNQPDERIRVVILASLVHNILRLYISVADSFRMHVIQSQQHLVNCPCNIFLTRDFVFNVSNHMRNFTTFVEWKDYTESFLFVVVIGLDNSGNKWMVHFTKNIVFSLQKLLIIALRNNLLHQKTHVFVINLLNNGGFPIVSITDLPAFKINLVNIFSFKQSLEFKPLLSLLNLFAF